MDCGREPNRNARGPYNYPCPRNVTCCSRSPYARSMSNSTLVILGTLIGFLVLAYALLAPVYFFLEREEKASKKWTKEELAKRDRDRKSSANGREGKGGGGEAE